MVWDTRLGEGEMKIRETKKLSSIYPREENFSGDLANHVIHLGVGNFTDVEVESRVGTRRADIVATGDDGVLVVVDIFRQVVLV